MLNRARRGETWRSLLDHLEADIVVWQMAATAGGFITATVVIWLTGNDVYHRHTRLSSFSEDTLSAVGLTQGRIDKVRSSGDFALRSFQH